MSVAKSVRQIWLTASQLYGEAGVCVAIVALEALAVLALFTPWPPAFWLCHGLGLGLQAHAVYRRKDKAAAGWLMLGLALSLPIPLFGWLGAILCSVLRPRQEGPTALEELKQFTQMSGTTLSRGGLTRAEQLRQALGTPNNLDAQLDEIVGVRSLVEGGVSERSQIRQLKYFLSNPRSDAYHLAQAEIARLLENFTIQLAEAGEQARARPGDAEEQHNLAQCYLRFAESGLLEDNLESHYIEMGLARYLDLIDKHPKAKRWRLIVIQILLSRGRIAEAISQCRAGLQREPENSQMWMGLFEAHYQGARAGALEPTRQFFELIRTMRELAPKDPILRELIHFWTKPAC